MAGKKVLIDGYNVMHAAPARFARLTDLAAQRDHLLRVAQSHPTLRGKKTIIFFDGSLPATGSGQSKFRDIRIIFSGDQKEADDLIQETIRRDAGHCALEVISSDRDIQNTARDHGGKIISSRQFWATLDAARPPATSGEISPPEPRLSDREVKEWLKLFRERKSGPH